jgi:hypothetical protein
MSNIAPAKSESNPIFNSPEHLEMVPHHLKGQQRLHFLTGKEAMRQLSESLQRRRDLESKRLYFLTVTYTLKKDEEVKEDQQRTPRSINWSFERVHRRLLRNLAGSRNYHRGWFRSVEPTIYVFVDAPNSKQKNTKMPLHVGNRDSTLHHHVIIVADAVHEDDLDYLVASKDPVAFLFGKREKSFGIREMKFQRVEPGAANVADVVNYASSWAIEHYNSKLWDDYFAVYPSARSEARESGKVKGKGNSSGISTGKGVDTVSKCGTYQKEEREKRLLKLRLDVIERERFDRARLKDTGWMELVPVPKSVTSRLALIDSLKRIDGIHSDTGAGQGSEDHNDQ